MLKLPLANHLTLVLEIGKSTIVHVGALKINRKKCIYLANFTHIDIKFPWHNIRAPQTSEHREIGEVVKMNFALKEHRG